MGSQPCWHGSSRLGRGSGSRGWPWSRTSRSSRHGCSRYPSNLAPARPRSCPATAYQRVPHGTHMSAVGVRPMACRGFPLPWTGGIDEFGLFAPSPVRISPSTTSPSPRSPMTTHAALAIEATGLVKSFGETRAVDGVDLAVRAGSVYGVLGPNGAGKTTTIRMLATLIRPDAGSARVLGHDIVEEADAVRAAVSLTGQLA